MLNQNLLLTGDDGYNLTKSLRFRNSATAYMTRTPASAGNRQKFTLSYWVKPGIISSSSINPIVFSAGNASTRPTATLGCFLTQANNNVYRLESYNGSGYDYGITTTQVFRDPSAWYHIVVAFDTTQATDTNRIKLYVNGSQITAFSTASYPSQNLQLAINNTVTHGISTNTYNPGSNGDALDGYLAEMNFIDGQQLTPSSFGSTNALTGVWQPAKYTGTYGTNGFYLDFKDNSSTAALGYDAAGSNDWTVNNISLTAGTTYDSMVDVPTMSALGSNYCVMNPIASANALSYANLRQGTSAPINFATFGQSTGKWYWEVTITTQSGAAQKVGVANSTATGELGDTSTGWAMIVQTNTNGYAINNGSYPTNYTTFAQGDILNISIDLDSGKIWWGKNGTWLNSGVPASGTGAIYTNLSGTIFPASSNIDKGIGAGVLDFNFGQRPFSYTPPTGFVALNTFNLPEPSIKAGNKYMDATLYVGTGADQNITTLNFEPSFTWIKNRASAYDHYLYDAVRGGYKKLSSNTTDAEATQTNGLSAFLSNGFSLVGNRLNVNESGSSHVAWNWKANGTGSSNTAGSITSTVSANPTAGFSVVTYTGTGSAGATVGHGLGVAPKMVIVKERGNANVWGVGSSSLTSWAYHVRLNATNAESNADNFWNSTAPTSSVFTLGDVTAVNRSGGTYVAYCFAEVAGYSKFGSYTGNGSTDGTFVHLGFRPKFVMIKRSDGVEPWLMLDSVRQTYNVIGSYLIANASDAEGTFSFIDFTSNGFKIRNTGGSFNASGGTYIYMAFAENPQKYSLGR